MSKKDAVKKEKAEDKYVDELIGTLQKVSSSTNVLASTSVYDINDWIDTGVLALNLIISNSFTRGIPANRFTQLYGASQSGKSLILSMTGANAQNKGYRPILAESEFGETTQSLVRKGFDPAQLVIMPCKTVEQWQMMMDGLLKIKQKFPERKIFPMLDSLGNLGTEYENKKMDEGKKDMGHRAKDIKAVFRRYMIDFGLAGIPFVFTNHVFENQAQQSQEVTGGHGVKFMPTITLQFSKGQMLTKGEGSEKRVLGTVLHVSTFKNRITPPYKRIDLVLDFAHGFKKYSGLLPVALRHELLKPGEKGKICAPHIPKVSYWESQILDGEIGDKVWQPILPKLEELILKNDSFYSPEVEAEAEAEKEKLKKEGNLDDAQEEDSGTV